MTHDSSSRTLHLSASTSYRQSARRQCLTLLERLFAGYRGPVSFRLWDATPWGDPDAPTTVVFNEPGPLREMILGGDLLRLAEAHLAGRVDLEGEPEGVLTLVDHFRNRPLSWSDRLGLLGRALMLPGGHQGEAHQRLRAGEMARHNSRHSIAHHYDVSNDFYRLWLDPEMVYSCAYFASPEQSLEAAQRDKLDIICRKLRLAPGQRLLDIGCGWGALVRWAARHYGVSAHGITLSEQQYQLARERIQADDLEDRVTVELRDYRKLPDDQYDRVVSVGMFEHIGIEAFPEYFATVKRVLYPGGLFLNHGITSGEGWNHEGTASRFINQYVFPDGELARVSRVITAMEEAGFEVLDLESLRRHYALTLRQWVKRLRARYPQAREQVGEATFRVWQLYMAGSAYCFEQGATNIYQILAGHYRQPLEIPLRREDLYR